MGMFLQTNVRTNGFNFYCGKMINTIMCPSSDTCNSVKYSCFDIALITVLDTTLQSIIVSIVTLIGLLNRMRSDPVM